MFCKAGFWLKDRSSSAICFVQKERPCAGRSKALMESSKCFKIPPHGTNLFEVQLSYMGAWSIAAKRTVDVRFAECFTVEFKFETGGKNQSP